MTGLPNSLLGPLQEILRGIGDHSPIRSARSVGGGCINHAQRLETGSRTYLLKWNHRPLPGMFTREAEGLERIRTVGVVRVPGVAGWSEAKDQQPAFLLLEWIEPPEGQRAPRQDLLGLQLARLHRAGFPPENDHYGLDVDNYIGSTPQLNGWERDWVRFFRERRLRPQLKLAQRNNCLPASRRDRLEKVLDRLDEWLGGVPRQPALLHGDLWGGNVLTGPRGEPVLIDPAVYYGDREAEIAFTELFGGFSPAFYDAYHSAWPIEPGYNERRDLYNLYHLLNHLNLFGESYGVEVDEVCKRYVGK